MPTGYTAEIARGEKDVSFTDFVLQCARAFGALITMRDDPMDAPIPDKFEPSKWYVERIKETEAELAEIGSWNIPQANEAASADYAKRVAAWNQRRVEREAQRQRYEAMLKQVEAWEPPSPDHVELKNFMADQLRDSIKHDCDGSYDTTPKQQSGAEFVAEKKKSLEHSLAYYAAEHVKEVQRANDRTRWIQQLRDSLRTRA